MSLAALPTELLLAILALIIPTHSTPSTILTLNKRIFNLSASILYAHPHLRSTRALERFPSSNPPRVPRSIEVSLAGGEVGAGQFRALREVFRRCARAAADAEEDSQSGMSGVNDGGDEPVEIRLEVEELSLQMNTSARSHADSDDPTLDALRLVSPRKFSWTGCDPPHHFSVAIVPSACTTFFARASRWTVLTSLHLSDIAFPPAPAPFAFPPLPSLERMHIGRATCVPVRALAAFVCARAHAGLGEGSVRLVDCYVESIWGGRVRRGDVERVAGEKWEGDDEGSGGVDEARVRVDRVRSVVVCEAVTERIEGGDRIVDGVSILE